MTTPNPMPDPNIYDIREDGTVYGKRSGKLIPIRTSRYGLPQIRFYKGHRYRVQLLSKIIWTHFHGEIPFMHEVRYVDGDPWNCALDNLYLSDEYPYFPPKGDKEDGPKYKPIIEEDGKEYMPVEYYIHMVDGVKGERESGIPQNCRIGSY